jgi:hypothetical protein
MSASRICHNCGKKIPEKSEWLYVYPELSFCGIECMEVYRGIRDPRERLEREKVYRPLDVLHPLGV